jgi:hypothetical protein
MLPRSVKTIPAVTFAMAMAVVASLAAGVSAAEVSPFAADEPVATPVAARSDPLGGYEFVAVSRIVAVDHVCLFDVKAQRSRWLTLGSTSDGLRAEKLDDARSAVLVRSGEFSRWLVLRGARIVAMPVAHRDDRSIDWQHVKLADREKEVKAAMKHWELMEVSRQARTDGDSAPPVPVRGQR